MINEPRYSNPGGDEGESRQTGRAGSQWRSGIRPKSALRPYNADHDNTCNLGLNCGN